MSWGQAGARQAYHTGRGSIVMRAKAMVEENRGERRSIVLTEIPYQVGKSGLVEKIAEAVKDKRIEGVSDIRDESNREGVRVVIELKRDATPEVVLNQVSDRRRVGWGRRGLVRVDLGGRRSI